MAKNNLTINKAELIVKRYIIVLYRLLTEERAKFDLIVAPADSGTFMLKIVEMLYEHLGSKSPKVLLVPLQRYKKLGIDTGDHFDNSVLVPGIRKELKDIKKVKRVLFVDDEIGTAWTAKETIRVVLKAIPKKKKANRILYTIVAESHTFEWHYDIPPVAIQYYAFSKKQPGVNGAVFEVLSKSTYQYFTKFDAEISKKKIISILLDGRIKVSGKIPTLSTALHEQLQESGSNFSVHQKRLEQLVQGLIQQGIAEYKSGKIEFRQ